MFVLLILSIAYAKQLSDFGVTRVHAYVTKWCLVDYSEKTVHIVVLTVNYL
mgnify:CR=1 FL=1